MTDEFEENLIKIVENMMGNDDPSHDIQHIQRVLNNAKNIAIKEGADLDIVIPAALCHDLVNYPKNDPRNKLSVTESADKASEILSKYSKYPSDKIAFVKQAIKCTSFSYGQKPSTIEDKTVRDADMLEATGAISIMRTFSSSGRMQRPFYEITDPFAEKRDPDDLKYSLDLFYTRLLKIHDKLCTESAKVIAERRTAFLKEFLHELKLELEEK